MWFLSHKGCDINICAVCEWITALCLFTHEQIMTQGCQCLSSSFCIKCCFKRTPSLHPLRVWVAYNIHYNSNMWYFYLLIILQIIIVMLIYNHTFLAKLCNKQIRLVRQHRGTVMVSKMSSSPKMHFEGEYDL